MGIIKGVLDKNKRYVGILLLVMITITVIIFVKNNSSVVMRDTYDVELLDRVGYVFEEITTNGETYDGLRDVCDKYIGALNKVNGRVKNVDVVIDEDLHIDDSDVDDQELIENITVESASSQGISGDTVEGGNIEIDKHEKLENIGIPDLYKLSTLYTKKIEKEENKFVMANTVYFQNIVLNTYVNSNGSIYSVFGIMGNDGSYKCIESKDIRGYLEYREPESETTIDLLYENEYILNVDDCLTGILTGNAVNYKEVIDKYMTSSSVKVLSNLKYKLGINKNTNIMLNAAICGKSDEDITVKDRVYLQYKIDESIVDIIIKLDGNKIFDIDVV